MKIPPAFLFIIIATIIWGATPAIMKLTLTQIPVFSLAFIRMLLASSILYFFVRKNLKIQKQDYYRFFYLALTGVTLNLTFFFLALTQTKAVNSAFLTPAVPILTIFAAHIYLKEKLDFKIILAGIISAIGVIIIFDKPTGPAAAREFLGNTLLLLSSLSWVIHEIIAKKLLKNYEAGTIAFYAMFIGAVTFFPLYIYELFKYPQWITNVTISGYLGLAYGIFFASLAAYWAWQIGLKNLPAGQASFFFYLDPITGGIVSYLLLGEKITPSLIFGGCFIAAGVLLAEYRRQNHPLHQKHGV